MKSGHVFGKKLLAVMLAIMMIVPMIPVQTTALTYNGSSSYKSGKYYSQLVAVNLTGNQRVDIVNVAKSQVGYQEGGSSSQLSGTVRGNNNYTEYGRWYGLQDMWCAMFVSWCANVAQIPTSIVPSHSYTPTGLNWFKNKGQAYSRATVASGGYTPKAGDIIYFKSARNQNITNHIGIVTSYSGSTVYTIEGNTSSATISTNGGAVAAKSYSISNTYIVYICKPAYTSGDTVATSNYISTIDTGDAGSVSKQNAAVTNSKTVRKGANNGGTKDDTFVLRGWGVHTNGVDHFEWNLDNTNWGVLDGQYRTDVENATKAQYPNCVGTAVNAFNKEVSLSGITSGTHTIQIRGVSKKSEVFTVGTLTLYVLPKTGTTYMKLVDSTKTKYAVNDSLMITAKGDHAKAWVGLFAATDVPGNVASYLWYEMGANEATFDLIASGKKNSRGDITPGSYKLILFVDSGYIQEASINITLTNANLATLDTPKETTYANEGSTVLVRGWGLHDSGISKFTYCFDGGTEKELAAAARADVLKVYPAYAESCKSLQGFDDNVSTAGLSIGSHLLYIYAYPVSGEKFSVGTAGVVVRDPNTSIATNNTTYELGDGIVVTATSKNPNAWVGLFLSTDTISTASPFYSFKVGSNSGVDVNLFEGTKSTTRTMAAGTYKVVLFKDTDNDSVDKSVTITITAATEFHSSYDDPVEAFSVRRGETFLIKGWGISNVGVTKYELIIDKGEPVDLPIVVRADVMKVYPTYIADSSVTHAYAVNYDSSTLTVGEHTITTRAVLTNGKYRDIGTRTITVLPGAEELMLTPKADSGISIDRSGSYAFTKGVDYRMTAANVAGLFEEECKVVDKNGKEVTGYVGTGCKVLRYDGTSIVDTVVIIVIGDLDGDGLCTIKDMLMGDAYINCGVAVDYPIALDLTNNNVADANDLTQFIAAINACK